jgi:hypothetical protein
MPLPDQNRLDHRMFSAALLHLNNKAKHLSNLKRFKGKLRSSTSNSKDIIELVPSKEMIVVIKSVGSGYP